MVSHINTNGTLPTAPDGELPEMCLTALRDAYASGAATPSSIIQALYPALSKDRALFITLAPLAELLARCRCAWRSHPAPSTSISRSSSRRGRLERRALTMQCALLWQGAVGSLWALSRFWHVSRGLLGRRPTCVGVVASSR